MAPAAAPGALAQPGQEIRVLLLEDDPSMVALLRHYLARARGLRLDLSIAETLHQATAALAVRNFDLAIVDLHVPDSSGIGTLAAIAGAAHEAQIIVLTADSNAGLREAAIAHGAYEFLHKGRLDEEAFHRLVRLAAVQARNVRSLRESNARLRSLTALSSDAYWEQDTHYRFTAVTGNSPRWLRALQPTLLGKHRWDQPYFNMTAADWEAHRAVLDARQPFQELELGRVNESGEEVWVAVSGEPVFDGDRFVGYRGISRDITARKQDERLLRLEMAVTRELADAEADDDEAIRSVLGAICESEGWKCGRFFRLDRPAGRMRFDTGWHAADERLAAYMEDSRQLSFAHGEGLVGRAWQTMQSVWTPDAAADARTKRRVAWRQSGLRAAFLFPAVARGEAMGVAVIASDAIRQPDDRLLGTMEIIGRQLGHFLQRRQSEAERRVIETRLRQTFELAGSGIAHVDLDGRFLRANRKLCDILGYSAEELVGRSVREISHPEDRHATEALLKRMRGGALDSIHVEKRYLRKDTSVVWVDLTVALARGENGDPQYEIAVVEDITGRKRAEQLQALEHGVNRILADAAGPAEALRQAMRAICESEDWDCARYFELDEAAALMRFRQCWYKDEAHARRWGEASRSFSYRPGEGLVGTAWRSGQPLWVSDMTHDARVAHPQLAQEAGMHAAFHFPVAFEGRTIGVISISSRSIREPDGPLLEALGVIGRQIGQYLQRQRSQHETLRFRAALDASADMVFLVGFESARFLDFNETACRYLGYDRAELLGRSADQVLAEQSVDELLRSHRDLLGRPDRADSRLRTFVRKDGSRFHAEVLRRIVESPDGPILVINARDLTERRAAEQRQSAHLRYQEKISRLGQSALGMRDPAELIGDAAQSVREGLAADVVAYLEPGAQAYSLLLREALGLADGLAPAVAYYGGKDSIAAVLERAEPVVVDNATRAPLPFEWAHPARSAALVPVHGERGARGALCALSARPQAFGPDELRFIEAAANVLSAGLQRIDSESRLAFLAQFDALTGLPNRSLLSDRFSQVIAQAQRRGAQLGVLFIDLDDFKLVNDTLGHAGGDELLREVAARLRRCVRAGDTVARISGDEFAVILADLPRAEDAALVAEKIIAALSAPMRVRGQEVFVSASIGIAAHPADGEDAEALLAAADAAMYRAKESSRNSYQFFTAEINQRSRVRAQLGSELHRALERDEFCLFYQPKVDLALGKPCGAEALLRWRHPERGLVSPGEFIPVLEETGLIVPVGEWVLRRACEDVKAWTASGGKPWPVSVNLSARQFRQPDLHERLLALIRAAQVDARLLELEITESQLMHDPNHAILVLTRLRDAGLHIAIDDFGTGYSSLSYLTRFPLAALKIDRSFVANVLSDAADATIVRTIVDMAKALGLTVIAEGVETQAQAAFLRGLACEQAQGYLFAKPMPAAQLRAFFGMGV